MITGQAMYGRSVTLRRVRAAINAVENTYSECVCVALVFQYALRMRHIVIFGMSGYTIFVHVMSLTARFRKVTEYKMLVLIFPTTFV
jgi:hypothetical protein